MPLSPGVYGGQALNAAQLQNAQTIRDVGKQMGASGRDIMIALMTAMQESSLRNLNHGHLDSLGLFQQRPSQGWGTPEQVTNPVYASRKFYETLFNVRGRNSLAPTVVAQRVQRSAFPNAYAKWQGMAASLVKAMGGQPVGNIQNAGFGSTLGALADVAAFITNPKNWYRVGLFVVGSALLIVGFVVYMGGNTSDIVGSVSGIGKALKGVTNG